MPLLNMLILAAVVLAAVGVGVVAAAVVAAAIIALTSAGVLSTSIVVGLTSRNPFTGLRLAMAQVFAVLGGVAGAGLAGVVGLAFDTHVFVQRLAVVGLAVGVGVGLGVSLCFDKIIRIAIGRMKRGRAFEPVVRQGS